MADIFDRIDIKEPVPSLSPQTGGGAKGDIFDRISLSSSPSPSSTVISPSQPRQGDIFDRVSIPTISQGQPGTRPAASRFQDRIKDFADKLFTAHTGLTPEQGIKGKEQLGNVISRAPAVAMAVYQPLIMLGFEALNQAKNAVVTHVKQEKYSPLETRVLSELIPDEAPTALKIASMGTEYVTDVALMGAATNLAKRGLLTDTIKTIGKKLSQAGYGEGKVTVNMDAVKEAAKGTTLEREAERWLRAKTVKIKPKGRITAGEAPKAPVTEPATVSPSFTEVKPPAAGPGRALVPVEPQARTILPPPPREPLPAVSAQTPEPPYVPPEASPPATPPAAPPAEVKPGGDIFDRVSLAKAEFKIRKDADIWKVPVEAGGLRHGAFTGKTKKITNEKAQKIFQDTLTDVEVSDQGEFVVIKGYPKKELSPKVQRSFSQYGSIGNVADIPQQTATVELKPIEPIEMVRMATELMGEPPTIRKYPNSYGKFYPKEQGAIGINRELFKRGNEKQLAATLAHEIGHLTDYLPEETLKRGNLFGRLMSLRKYLKNTFGEKQVTNKELREELKGLSKEWKPFDDSNSSDAFVQYRNSSVELYADFISVLFNNPGLAQQRAPQAFNMFFENLDKKPEVKQQYFYIQDLLNGEPAEILNRRESDIRQMFVKGVELRKQKRLEKELAEVNYYERIRQLVDDVNYPIISKRQKLESKGTILPREDSPEYALEERSLVDNDNFLLMQDIDRKVLHELTGNGLTDEDLGVYLFLKRVQGRPQLPLQTDLQVSPDEFTPFDEIETELMKKKFFDVPGRKDIANPLGFAPNTAAVQLNHLAETIGPEKFAALERIGRDFHEIIWPIVQEAVEVGSFNRKTFEEVIKPNKDFYVTFGVLNYLQNHVPATVKMQKGTLRAIENPLVTTILKMISLNRLNARQRAVNSLRDWMTSNFPDEITKVEKDFRGNLKKPKFDSGKDLVHLLEDGKMAAYEVDQYIARSVENTKNGDVMLVGHMINKLFGNPIFKNLYITYNPGFAFAFNPIRDFKRTYVNLNALGQKVSVGKLLVEYARSLPASARRQRGIDDTLIREMMENKALDVPFIDFNFDIHGDSYSGILKQIGLLKGEEHLYAKMMRPILRPVLQIMEGIRFAGSTLESLSKVAGYNVLKNDPKLSSKQIAYLTRNYIGTPNYRKGGTITSTTNAVWIFSNIMKEGLKTDIQLAKNPSTRSGFWWSHFKINMFYKMLMVAGATGLLGTGIKKIYDGVTEYDKTNYIIIPLGEDTNGKSVYFRVPHDETGRLMAAVFWKTAMGIYQKDPQQLQQIFAFGAGQMPSLAPGITIGATWMQYLSGKNPYDSYRGQYLISDTAWKAGGYPALKKMVQWTANNSGLLQFSTYDDANQTTFESTIRTIPGLNRLIKVSDFGETEQLRKIRQRIDKETAQRTLKKRELIDKAVERAGNGESVNTLAREIANKIYDKPTGTQIRNIMKDIRQDKERGRNVYLDQLMTARTNEEKIILMRQMREVFDKDRMRQLEKEILRLKAASPAVIRRSRRE